MLMKSRDDARQIVGANIQGFVDNVSVRLNRLDPLLHTLMSGIFLLSRCQCIPCSLISHGCAFFFFFFFFFFFGCCCRCCSCCCCQQLPNHPTSLSLADAIKLLEAIEKKQQLDLAHVRLRSTISRSTACNIPLAPSALFFLLC